MKKSILTIALAAMMLVAFTACEQPQMEWPYTGEDAKDVINVTIVDPSALKVYAGEAFKAETYISIERLDDTVDTVIGSVEIATPVPGRNTATVSWGTGNQTGTGKVFVDAYALAGDLAVTFDPEKLADEDGTSLISDLEDVEGAIKSVVAKYSDGKEKTISAGYKVELNTESGEVTVTYSNIKYTTETLSFTTTLTLVKEPEQKKEVTLGEVTDLSIDWIVDEKVVATGTSYEATVGQTVSYKVYGVVADMTGRTPLLLVDGTTYDVISGEIKSTELQADDITNRKPSEEAEATKAFTATIQFLPSSEVGDDGKVDPNFGLDLQKTLTMTVKDTLKADAVKTAVEATNFKYRVDEEGAASKIPAGKETTIVPSDFTATVKTVGGVEVKIQGFDKYGATNWKLTPDAEGTLTGLGNFTFTWKTVNDQYGHFEGVVTGVKVDAEVVAESK